MNRNCFISLVMSAVLLSACGAGESEPKAEHAAGEGREETGLIRNTENVGQSGDAIADKVDRALDANEQRTEQLDRQLGEE